MGRKRPLLSGVKSRGGEENTREKVLLSGLWRKRQGARESDRQNRGKIVYKGEPVGRSREKMARGAFLSGRAG